MSSELAMNLRRDAEQAEEIFLPWPEAYKLAAARIEALEAGNVRLWSVVDAVEQHDNSNFYGPDADKNRRASWRGVMRKIKAARRAREGDNKNG